MPKTFAKCVLIIMFVVVWRVLCGLDAETIDKIFRFWLAIQFVTIPLSFINTKGDKNE